MDKYYITADLKREALEDEHLPVKNGLVYAGRIKAIVEAETWQDAMASGKEIISGCLKKQFTPINWGWMPVKDAEAMGDTAIYDKYHTATKLAYHRIKAGLTQKQLSAAAGINIRQIQRVELGEADAGNLTARNLLALADALGVPPEELI